MKTLDDLFEECSKNPEFIESYADLQPEMEVMRALMVARTSQNLTQKELSERTGIAQTEISRIERGTRNPSVRVLQKLAKGMGMYLQISFVPREEYIASLAPQHQ